MKKTMIQLKKHQKGLTVVELVIAITLSLLVVAGGILGASKFIAGNKVSRTLEELPLIFTKTQKAYSSQSTYAGITLTNLVNNRVFPPELVTAGATPTVANRFDGTITVAAGNISGANTGAAFTLSNLPEDACIDVVNGMNAAAARITVDGTVVKAINGTINIGTLGTNCNDSTANSVEFLISK